MLHADVAVIVPVFNRATGVLATLASVTTQATLPNRLVVVDDGSTDGTAESVRNWIARTRPACDVLVVEQPNPRQAAQRGTRGFLEAGDCNYVAYLDSDDRWPEDFLIRAVERLEADPEAVAASTDRVYHRRAKRRLGKRSSRGLEPQRDGMAHRPQLGNPIFALCSARRLRSGWAATAVHFRPGKTWTSFCV